MVFFSNDFSECYGCFSCIDACPVKAIRIETHSDSFFYPSVDTNKCIQCNRCKNVCPNKLSEKAFSYPISSFAGIIKDKKDFTKSSSGGAFKAIVKACLNYYSEKYSNYYCVGVIFNESFNAIHDIVKINNYDDVDKFSKSKYVQSNPVGIYNKVKEIVDDENNFLIFTGSPCQVAAIKTFLEKPYDNLFCIDLICHGAPSQQFFDSYIQKIQTQYNSKLISYEFRTKEKLDNGTQYTRSARYCFENGIEKRVSRLEDDYLITFYNEDYVSRPSCVSCSFSRPERVSDITIGDAWRINYIYNDLVPTKGISSIIFVTNRSLKLEKFIRTEMITYELDYSFMIEHNKPLRRSNE